MQPSFSCCVALFVAPQAALYLLCYYNDKICMAIHATKERGDCHRAAKCNPVCSLNFFKLLFTISVFPIHIQYNGIPLCVNQQLTQPPR